MGTLAIPDGGVVLLDSMCVIYAVEGVAPYAALLQPVITDIEAGRLRGVLSTLTIAEVLTKPLRDGDDVLADAFRKVFSHTENVGLVPVDVGIAEAAASLRARYGLRTPDAVQIATAVHAGCTHLISNEPRWPSITEIPILVLDDYIPAP